VGNFDYVDVIANLIKQLIENKASGVYNIGTELKTMLSLAGDVTPILAPEIAPKNVSMNINKLLNVIKGINQ
jgi:hypothetical protein